MKIKPPPIKCQGIKTKLVPLIREVLESDPAHPEALCVQEIRQPYGC